MLRFENVATPAVAATVAVPASVPPPGFVAIATVTFAVKLVTVLPRDRKSTRLNSSHLVISYAVFCLKKKKKTIALVEGQIARSPSRDRPRELLIRAIASAGRRADACRAFQHYRSLLSNVLSTDPSHD